MKGNRFFHNVLSVLIACTVCFGMAAYTFAQTTYYVDTTGNNTNNGTSTSSAWKTISKVNSSSFNPGDQILFKRGEVWREQLTVPSSGSPGNHIVFGAYGTGEKPIIMGSDKPENWYEDTGQIVEIWGEHGTSNHPETAKDATIIGGEYANTQFGNEQYWTIQSYNRANSQSRKVLFKFDLSSGTGTVTGVTFNAKMYNLLSTPTIIMNKCTTNWVEDNVTWNSYNGVDAWPGVNHSESTQLASYSLTSNDLGKFISLSDSALLNEVQAVYGSGTLNFSLKHDYDLTSGRSSERSTESERPYLAINLEGGSGLPNVWETTFEIDPVQLNFIAHDGTVTLGNKKLSKNDLIQEFDWYWLNGKISVYSTSNPTIAYKSIEGQIRYNCISIASKDYIKIENIHVQLSTNVALNLDIANNCIIDNVEASLAYTSGIRIDDESKYNLIDNCISHHNGGYNRGSGVIISLYSSDNIVQNGIFYNNGEDGVQVGGQVGWTAGPNNIVQDNDCYGNDESGVDIKDGPQLIRRNKLHDNGAGLLEGAGIVIGYDSDRIIIIDNEIYGNLTHGIGIAENTNGDSHIIAYNKIYNNGDKGISANSGATSVYKYNLIYNNGGRGFTINKDWCSGSKIFNNLIWNNVGYQLVIQSSNITVKNNIIGGRDRALGIYGASIANEVSDYNLLNGTGNFFEWMGRVYDLNGYLTLSKLDSNSVTGDPMFTNPSNNNFTLQEGSPLINAGINVGLTDSLDFAGNAISDPPDIGPFEYQSGAPPPPAAPTIASDVISPNSGYVNVGDSVAITVTAGGDEAGLTASNATINGKQAALADLGDGTYVGIYVVEEGDNDGTNVEATNITLTGAGGTSDPASSSGSTLNVDAHTPVISSVTISPNLGWVTIGDTVVITVIASNSETGLTPSNASINWKSIPLTDKGDGTYTGTYIAQVADDQGVNIEAGNITLTDAAGNVSSAVSTGSTLKVDTQTPGITSVTINPDSGWVNADDEVTITVSALDNEAGLIPSNASINGQSIPLTDEGGGTYTGTYTVQVADAQGVNIEAANITLTDGAGNVSDPASSTGSTLSVDTTPPAPPPGAPIVASVVINPNSGSVMVGDSVIITATAENNETGLTPSDATMNSNQVSLTDRGDGTYVGVYTVTGGDNDGVNIEATNITFTGAGGTSDPASSTGSTLNVDAHAPVISSVTISPNSGWVKDGDDVSITVTALNNETGLTPSNASINGKSISLTDEGDGTYTGTYTVQVGDIQGENIEAANITLADAAGNVSSAGASSGSTLKVDTQAPTITSVTINPSSDTVRTGNNVDITVTAGGNEAGLTASNAQINGKSIPLTDQSDGTYTGTYTVQSGDDQGENIEATNITLTDAAGNLSEPAFSSGSTLSVDTTPTPPPSEAPTITSVVISPNSGSVMVGDSVTITATAGGNEAGLTTSDATINGKQVSLADQGDGTYVSVYNVMEGDNDGINIEATNITFTGAGGTSAPASSSGSTLIVDARTPVITSVILNPNSGWLKAGDDVTIIAAAKDNETGLVPSNASINGRSIALTDQGDGTYTGTYTVQAADAQSANIEATGITLTDAAGNVSAAGASSGSTLKVDTQPPVISSVTINPSAGFVTAGNNVFITLTAGGNEAGLTVSNAQINGKSITLANQGDGTYTGIYAVQAADSQAVNMEAANITLTDAAGNISNAASSSGSTLNVDTQAPGIALVILSPNSGWLKSGDNVTITIAALNNESGLTPSNALINGSSISLADQGDGIYSGTYTLQAADAQGVNIEATNITLTDAAGNVSSASSSSGSTLKVDTQAPGIASVTLSPNSGWLKSGDGVTITVAALNNESGLTPSNALINGKSISLTDQGNGTYTGTYTVQAADAQGVNIGAAGITLTDAAGNVSDAGASSASTLKVDTQAPTIVSVTINPSTGTVTTGNNVVITVTAGNNEAGLTASNAQINGKSTTLVDQGNGTYTGTYNVQAGDNQGANVEATSITLTDAAGNVSDIASSTGSNLSVDTMPIPPPVEAPTIASVTISPNSGSVKVSDTVNIIVTAGNNQTGLTPSDATINGKQISLTDQGDGTYVGIYAVAEGDNDGVNVEAANITLTSAGGTSAPTSSSGSTLKIDAHTPTIASVMIIPNSGMVTIGDTVAVLVTAGSNEAGLTASNAEINGNSIPLSDLSNGLYGGLYIVQSSDTQRENIAATGITLTDPAGNVSNPASATSSLSVLIQPTEPTPTPEPTVVFIDEDLDPNDSLIVRNPDGTYMADNDDTLTFTWNSWEAQGAVKYQVNVYSDSAAFENFELTETTIDTSFTFTGEPGKIYCVEVIPMTVNDEPLTTLRSQAILCTAETPGVPGKPSHVIKKD